MSRLEASSGPLGQGTRHEAIDLERNVRSEDPRGRRCRLENVVDDRQVAVAAKRALSGEHLVEHDAERPEVGATVHGLALDLLRSHVRHRSHGRSRARRPGAIEQLRDAEVHDLDEPVTRDHQVRRLDVAMHDARAMGLVQPPRNLQREVERFRHRERPARQPLLQRGTLVVRHGDEQPALGVRVRVVDGADVRMIECRGGLRLLDEAFARLGVRGQLGWQKLQSDRALETGVFCAIHDTHAATTQACEHTVVRDDQAFHVAVTCILDPAAGLPRDAGLGTLDGYRQSVATPGAARRGNVTLLSHRRPGLTTGYSYVALGGVHG